MTSLCNGNFPGNNDHFRSKYKGTFFTGRHKTSKNLSNFASGLLGNLGTSLWFVHNLCTHNATQLQKLFFPLVIGRCVSSELTQYAVVKEAANYTDTLPEQDMETLEMSFNQAITLGQNQVTKNMEESPIIQSKDSVSTSPGPSATTLLSRKSEASVVSTHTPTTTLPQNKPDRPHQGELNITYIRSVVNQPSWESWKSFIFFFFFGVIGKLEMCDLYRDLDSCHLQIPALQEKFGLRNPDLRTLYHCNCTARWMHIYLHPNTTDANFIFPLGMPDNSYFKNTGY